MRARNNRVPTCHCRCRRCFIESQGSLIGIRGDLAKITTWLDVVKALFCVGTRLYNLEKWVSLEIPKHRWKYTKILRLGSASARRPAVTQAVAPPKFGSKLEQSDHFLKGSPPAKMMSYMAMSYLDKSLWECYGQSGQLLETWLVPFKWTFPQKRICLPECGANNTNGRECQHARSTRNFQEMWASYDNYFQTCRNNEEKPCNSCVLKVNGSGFLDKLS